MWKWCFSLAPTLSLVWFKIEIWEYLGRVSDGSYIKTCHCEWHIDRICLPCPRCPTMEMRKKLVSMSVFSQIYTNGFVTFCDSSQMYYDEWYISYKFIFKRTTPTNWSNLFGTIVLSLNGSSCAWHRENIKRILDFADIHKCCWMTHIHVSIHFSWAVISAWFLGFRFLSVNTEYCFSTVFSVPFCCCWLCWVFANFSWCSLIL